jgi:hypothetical protein
LVPEELTDTAVLRECKFERRRAVCDEEGVDAMEKDRGKESATVCGHPAFDWGESVEREVRAHDATHYRPK